MTVVGTRPEFVQIGSLTRAIRQQHSEILVNTGQHYDDNMAQIFFRELDLPAPDIDLGVGSGSHARQTGEIMMRLEDIVLAEKPDWVVVYGDTNSTVAAALVTAKLNIPLAHVEAGLRSFDRTMPEEVNRVLTDHISNVLFAPTDVAVNNLRDEGITDGVFLVGDVRVDVLAHLVGRVQGRAEALLSQAGLPPGTPFALTTIHRPANTDDAATLKRIVAAFNGLDIPVVLPAHPRLRKMLQTFGYQFGSNVFMIEPVGFLDMVALLNACTIVITDSGGLQKEAYMLCRPTVTVRDTTEWVETIEAGWNRLCDPQPDAVKAAVAQALQPPPATHPDYYGTVGVGQRMVAILAAH